MVPVGNVPFIVQINLQCYLRFTPAIYVYDVYTYYHDPTIFKNYVKMLSILKCILRFFDIVEIISLYAGFVLLSTRVTLLRTRVTLLRTRVTQLRSG